MPHAGSRLIAVTAARSRSGNSMPMMRDQHKAQIKKGKPSFLSLIMVSSSSWRPVSFLSPAFQLCSRSHALATTPSSLLGSMQNLYSWCKKSFSSTRLYMRKPQFLTSMSSSCAPKRHQQWQAASCLRTLRVSSWVFAAVDLKKRFLMARITSFGPS